MGVASSVAERFGECLAEASVVVFQLPDAVGNDLQALVQRCVRCALPVRDPSGRRALPTS
jgi:hypothetical protein